MATNVRVGIKSDLPAVLELIKELAEYEKAPEEVFNTLEDLEENGFGEKPLFEFFIAENEHEEVQGMALYCITHSTWKGKIIYLDDLVVRQQYRRDGVGLALIESLYKRAIDLNVNQIRWHVLDWNIPAIKFYEKIGLELDPEWITCKFSKEQIAQFVNKS